jgi:two-component system, sensor histidine kinase RegB
MPQTAPDLIPPAAYRRLLVLRTCAIGAQLAVLAVAHWGLGLALPVRASLAVVAAQGGSVVAAALWQPRRGAPQGLYATHLALDMAALTALFHLNGGYANPFAFSYLVPLALAATVLRERLVAGLAALALAGYALVCVWYRPLGHYHGALGDSFDLHLAGMVAGYAVSAALIVGFVLPAAQAQRRRAREAAALRARAARDADVVALGALLAGSAHALATPLGSALLLADELAETGPGATDARVQALRGQLGECQRSLRRALAAAADPAAARVDLPADAYLAALAQRFRVQRPEATLLARWPAGPAPRLDLDDRADQALLSVLHNAADVGAVVWLAARWHADALDVWVRDRGPGFTAPPVAGRTSKAHGHGLGLFLAGAVAEGLGGTLTLCHPRGGGTRVHVRLPLAVPAHG